MFVDFLFFHDLLKPGETITFAQYLTGVLSLPVMVLAALSWRGATRTRRSSAGSPRIERSAAYLGHGRLAVSPVDFASGDWPKL